MAQGSASFSGIAGRGKKGKPKTMSKDGKAAKVRKSKKGKR
jgi:hypothetical protein